MTASSSLLHLEATDESWVEVLDGAGKVQVQRVMRRGDVLDFFLVTTVFGGARAG
ncbi:MAG: DUF4115 domain-containing protein [Burkholderiaceae bacterium]